MSSIDNSSAFTEQEPTPSLDGPRCSICGKHFDDMAEMQRHSLTEHIQKGDLPGEQQKQEST
jgi:hypothetical protein